MGIFPAAEWRDDLPIPRRAPACYDDCSGQAPRDRCSVLARGAAVRGQVRAARPARARVRGAMIFRTKPTKSPERGDSRQESIEARLRALGHLLDRWGYSGEG